MSAEMYDPDHNAHVTGRVAIVAVALVIVVGMTTCSVNQKVGYDAAVSALKAGANPVAVECALSGFGQHELACIEAGRDRK